MKFNCFASALLFSAMFFSCTVEIDTPEVEETKVNDYVITAYSEESATKAEISSSNTILWQKDDRISVLSMAEGKYPANDLFTLESGEQTTSGTFRGSLSNPELSHVGVYPYNENHIYSVNGSLSWGKNIQIATEGEFDPEACLMAGQMDADGKISFKNICSYIKLTTDFACRSIVITSQPNPDSESDIKHLVSDIVLVEFDEVSGCPGAISPLEGFGKVYDTVTLVGQYDEEGYSKLIPAGTYYVAVLPQEYYGLTFTFNTEFGKAIEKSTKSDAQIEIKRNTIANVGTFTLDKLLPVGATGFAGSGTESDPYLISSLEKLQLLESQFADHKKYPSYTKDTYFLQTKDINCDGNVISIGSIQTDEDQTLGLARYYYPFTGIYDGGGYQITNYELKECKDDSYTYIAGLFNNVYQGTIKNLSVAPAAGNNNEIISSGNDKKLYVGALIGAAGHHPTNNSTGKDAAVTVSNCHLIGGPYNVNASRSKVFGGLVGQSCGDKLRLENCSNEASLSTADGNSGTDGSENIVGGLIGEVSLSHKGGEGDSGSHRALLEISNCRNNGSISASSSYLPCFAGGMVGLWCDYNSDDWNNLEAHVSNSVNSGNVTTSSNRSSNSYIDVSETCGPSCAGGFFGFFGKDESTSYFHNCLNKGNIEASASNSYHARAGGFLGFSKEDNNTSQNPKQDGSGDHVYAAMCVNTGSIIGHTDNVGSFCGTINGIKCVNCLWLDEHKYGDGSRAALPYRPGLDGQAGGNYDSEHDVYYYNTINTETIAAAFKKMIEVRHCKYDNNKFVLRWGYIDGASQDGGWKYWTAAWTGEAVWNSTNTLDIDFNSIINVDIDPSKL